MFNYGKFEGSLAVSVNDTARLLSCGRTQVYKLASNGTLLKIKIGRSTRITLDSILALLKKEG